MGLPEADSGGRRIPGGGGMGFPVAETMGPPGWGAVAGPEPGAGREPAPPAAPGREAAGGRGPAGGRAAAGDGPAGGAPAAGEAGAAAAGARGPSPVDGRRGGAGRVASDRAAGA
jgi:hypothetical protein